MSGKPVELIIKGMSCGGCVNAVKRIVARKDPTAKLDIDLATGKAKGTATVASSELAAAITAGGYPATAG